MPVDELPSRRSLQTRGRRLAAWLVPLLVAVALTGCVDLGAIPPDGGSAVETDTPPSTDGDAGDLVEVSIVGLAFVPKEVEISTGTTVRWINYDAVIHTVTEGDPSRSTPLPLWDSPMLAASDVFERTFQDLGEWTYWCRTHPGFMKDAVVRVR